ncbi:MAG: hypothetical protein VX404_05865 [Planctomycetota bacterium]|nr:hypothetical protein [Planctomycetota bacterium]
MIQYRIAIAGMDRCLNFWRTALPMLLLAAIILWNWPTGPVDFGSTGPWSGLVLEVNTDSLETPPLLLIASLPATDQDSQICSLVVGTAIWDGTSRIPILLAGETDALRLQKIQLRDDTPALYRSTRGELRAFPVPEGVDIDGLIGGILQGNAVALPWNSRSSEQPVVTLSEPLSSTVAFEARCDDRQQKRWRGERNGFRKLWEQVEKEDPESLVPFIHGEATITRKS